MPTAEEEGYEDKTLTCDNASCQRDFDWTAGEQRFYDRVGISPPQLCKRCRVERDNQQPETLTCKACGEDYTYTAEYIINWRRNEGKWKRNVCKFCFLDPQRAKRLKEERKKKERKKKEKKQERRREDIVGYHLLEGGTDEENAEWEGIVNEDTYEVPSNVQSYEILSEAELYARIVEIHNDGTSINAYDHIMYGRSGRGHGFDDLDFDQVLSQAGIIADETDSSIIECRDSHTDYIVKYDTGRGVAVLICESEDEITKWRVKTCFQPSQSSAARKIREYRWVLA